MAGEAEGSGAVSPAYLSITTEAPAVERKAQDAKIEEVLSIFRAMRGYPWFPCPICAFTGSCDHTVFERARVAHPGLIIPNNDQSNRNS